MEQTLTRKHILQSIYGVVVRNGTSTDLNDIEVNTAEILRLNDSEELLNLISKDDIIKFHRNVCSWLEDNTTDLECVEEFLD